MMLKQYRIDFKKPETRDFLSVIIPVHKNHEGLDVTIKSLKNQTDIGMGVEILVVNDGGHDRINRLCKHHQVICIDIFPNCGSYYARNRGIEYSRGEYLAFLDADVFVPEDWLKSAVNMVQDFVYVAAAVEIDKNRVVSVSNQYELYHAFQVEAYLKENHFGVTAGLLVKRSVIEDLGGFDQRLRSGGDKEFGERVFDHHLMQGFLAAPSLIHPPRNFLPLLRKILRIKKWEIIKSKLYGIKPDYSIYKKFLRCFISLIPPHFFWVKTHFPNSKEGRFFRKYFFLWALKIIRNCAVLMFSFSRYRQKNEPTVMVSNPLD